MALRKMEAVIRVRRGTYAQWQNSNPVLQEGEIGYVTSGQDAGKFKVGDGRALWKDLPYSAARFPEDSLALDDEPASSELPESGGVRRLFQLTRNFLKWAKGIADPFTGHRHDGADSRRVAFADLTGTDAVDRNIEGAVRSEASERYAEDQKLKDMIRAIDYIPMPQKGAALGVATLDGAGIVPLTQLPESAGGGAESGITLPPVTSPQALKMAYNAWGRVTGSAALTKGDLGLGSVTDVAQAAWNHGHPEYENFVRSVSAPLSVSGGNLSVTVPPGVYFIDALGVLENMGPYGGYDLVVAYPDITVYYSNIKVGQIVVIKLAPLNGPGASGKIPQSLYLQGRYVGMGISAQFDLINPQIGFRVGGEAARGLYWLTPGNWNAYNDILILYRVS